MAKNDFKPFATGKGANVTSQSDWEALPALLSGFTAGKASSAQVNKALRQASFIAAALAQYTASKSGQDVLDDGDLSGFIAKMSAAFGKDFQTLDATLTALAGLATGADKLPYFTGNDKAGQTDLTSVGRDIIGKASIADILTYLSLGETVNLAKNAVPATRRVNSKPLTGDITLRASDVGAMPANADLPLLGVGQRYIDLSSAGMLTNVYYTNTGTKPILVIITPNNQNGVERSVVVDDVEIFKIIATSNGDQPYPISFVVPVGSKYKFITSGTFRKWVVLQ